MGKIVALDFGLKRTGIAITDDLNIIASPLTTIDSDKLIPYLKELCAQSLIDVIVLGEPKRLNNQDSHITANVRMLNEVLVKEFSGQKIVLYDERFTSKMASKSLFESGIGKKKRQEKGLVDMVSATIILQSYLAQR
jgi:putative Holliday junction resolvase